MQCVQTLTTPSRTRQNTEEQGAHLPPLNPVQPRCAKAAAPVLKADLAAALLAGVGVNGCELLTAPRCRAAWLVVHLLVVGGIALAARVALERKIRILSWPQPYALSAQRAGNDLQLPPRRSAAAVCCVLPVLQAEGPPAAIALEGEKVELVAVRHGAVLANTHEVCI